MCTQLSERHSLVTCPRCKEEEVQTEHLTLCEMCSCELQAWAEDKGKENKQAPLV